MVTVVPSEIRENNRDNVGWILLAVVKSVVFECQIGLAVCSSSVLSIKDDRGLAQVVLPQKVGRK